jgi:hypothetical protein
MIVKRKSGIAGKRKAAGPGAHGHEGQWLGGRMGFQMRPRSSRRGRGSTRCRVNQSS